MLAEPPARLRELCLGLHSLSLTLVAEHHVLEALASRLQALPRLSAPAADDLRFEFSSDTAQIAPPAGQLRKIFDKPPGEVWYAPDSDRLYMRYGERIAAQCDPRQGVTRISISDPQASDLWHLTHPFFMVPLVESLKRRGLFSIHAAGVSRKERGLVLVGASGSGKTTLAVTLARAGFDLLSDDRLFVSIDGNHLQIQGVADEIDVTENTVALFPELRYLLDEPRRPGWPKLSFGPEIVLGASFAGSSRPAAVVFPRIAHTDASRLEPISTDEALLETMPNILLTDPSVCQAHLAVLAQLTSTLPCYRLWTGQDFDDQPALLGKLLD